ncbi:phosphopantetheine-binding protein [Saprospiraceae bacterium]|jgi:acyl carrier protein|nr:phosphopantetheine-binding protein [Bacteroidota bacterium]MDB4727228.1 phosphopantetheine-binding protein [Saprospiraceae bacterium]
MKPIDKIIYLVSWMANVPADQIFPSTHIKEDLEVDSIDFMLLVVQIEKLFNVVLSTEQVERMETVKDANDLITRQLTFSQVV